jgi:glycolate oxidase iron-sulfur subunit
MDSPRGRIYLMKAGAEDRISMSKTVVEHFDTCLGCMACETACPSGVKYGPLIEETRAAIEHHHPRPFGDRLFRGMLFSLLPYPSRMRLMAVPLAFARLLGRLSWLTKLLPARLGALLALAPPTSIGDMMRDLPERTAPTSPQRMRVGLVTGCVQRAFFRHVNEATSRVLAAEGCEVIAPSAQGCCGALALHAGRDEDARAFARGLIATFERAGVDQIVVNAAGCGSAMKEYGHLLRDDAAWAERARRFAATVRDVTETLARLDGVRAARHSLPLSIAYHDACHLAHAQGVRREPRAVLESVPGLTVVPLAESEICCGSAGIFNLIEPEMGARLARRKVDNIALSGVQAVVTSNPGCILQIATGARTAGRPIPVFHIVELVDASMRGVGAREWLASART